MFTSWLVPIAACHLVQGSAACCGQKWCWWELREWTKTVKLWARKLKQWAERCLNGPWRELQSWMTVLCGLATISVTFHINKTINKTICRCWFKYAHPLWFFISYRACDHRVAEMSTIQTLNHHSVFQRERSCFVFWVGNIFGMCLWKSFAYRMASAALCWREFPPLIWICLQSIPKKNAPFVHQPQWGHLLTVKIIQGAPCIDGNTRVLIWMLTSARPHTHTNNTQAWHWLSYTVRNHTSLY